MHVYVAGVYNYAFFSHSSNVLTEFNHERLYAFIFVVLKHAFFMIRSKHYVICTYSAAVFTEKNYKIDIGSFFFLVATANEDVDANKS